jgi:hypothetical protein
MRVSGWHPLVWPRTSRPSYRPGVLLAGPPAITAKSFSVTGHIWSQQECQGGDFAAPFHSTVHDRSFPVFS